jgi:hypothetical protein
MTYYSSSDRIVACKVGWGSNLHPPMRVGVTEHVPRWPVGCRKIREKINNLPETKRALPRPR